MFTIGKLRKTEELNERDATYLVKMLARYAVTERGLWLQSLPWTKMKFRWCPAMEIEDGVMGCFTPLSPGTVYLMPNPGEDISGGERSYWVEQLFDVIVHELRHAWQWKRSRIGYLVCALPWLRNFTLEKDAKRQEEACAFWLKRWTSEQDCRHAAERNIKDDIIPEGLNYEKV